MPERVANDRFSTWTRTVVALHGRCLRNSTTVSPGGTEVFAGLCLGSLLRRRSEASRRRTMVI